MENKDLKQTAVEWLQEQLTIQVRTVRKFSKRTIVRTVSFAELTQLVEQAKEMEKQQHKDTWFESTSQFDNAAEMTYKKEFEQYYNETFKKA